MSRGGMLLMICALAGQGVSAGDISGRVVDAQTGEPIGRARVAIHVVLGAGQATEVRVLTDPAGGFSVSNLPDGGWQLSSEKPGYLGASMMLSGDGKSTPAVLRLTRQGVIEGAVVDEKGVGVPHASVQLFLRVIVDGRRQIQPINGAQADETGEFRIFGLAAGRYYLGTNATIQRLRDAKKVAYAPILYPGATDISAARPIDLQPGTEEHVKIVLQAVPAHQVRGQVTPAGRSANVLLCPQEPDRFPMALNLGSSWDEKTNTFTISGVPSGTYVLEATTQIDNRLLRVTKTIVVGDRDIDGILLEPGSLPEVTGRVTREGRPADRGAVSHIGLRSSRGNVITQIEEDGSFRFRDLPPDFYNVVAPTGSDYVRSIRQGGRDVLRDGIAIGELPPDPVEIDLSPHAATIEGVIAVPGSETSVVIVGMFRRVGGELIFDRQMSVGGLVAANGRVPAIGARRPGTGPARFTMQGVAPGEYVLLAWPPDAQLEYAEPEFMRQFSASGKTVLVVEGARLSVAVDGLLPKMDR